MMYFLKKRGLYYRPDSRGYTDNILEAGLYSKKETEFYRKNEIDPPVLIIPADASYRQQIEDLINKGKFMLSLIDMSEDGR